MRVKESQEVRDLQQAPAEKPAATPSPREKVSLEETEQVTQTVQEVRNRSAAEKAERFQQLLTAVKTGGYKPDPAQIAARILEDAALAARLRAMLLK